MEITKPDMQKDSLVVIIIKTIGTGTSGKIYIVYKLLSQPHKHVRHGKLKNTTQASNQRLTSPLNPSCVSVSNTMLGRQFHIKPWAGRKHLASSMGRSTH